ncbi:uncharacterized protein F4822DRAFT_445508 [Hypoxylon trugodes]|uniref:uncharacterized protein n=1 Tax=Hypoxylon trugodes TaxID=326681 RepID=UPI00219C5F5C|nr:uncharacterized protein F4822DRAFT_445508 [Hypoxylon trugodes]KAI1385572.1 hypothetical protein F4822DRAFT_445508 [Hypoxylon trugodes]
MASYQGTTVSQPLYHWDPKFDSQRRVSDRLDEPFDYVRDEQDVDSGLISRFMQVFDENDSCNTATDLVVKFCKGAELHNLQQDLGGTTERTALLNDSGGLTARDLYQALIKPKKVRKGLTYIHKGRIHHRKEATNQIGKPETEIYIANLNRWSVVALAATTSNRLVAILGEFIFNHLKFDPLINAKIHHIGFPIFSLEFHLPYFPLRRHRLPQMDNRQAPNGNGTLRGYQDISFLRTMGTKVDNSLTEYVYDARLSCLVCGSNSSSWSVYLFNDLYFETEEESESIRGYHEDRSSGFESDPFTAGKLPPGSLPRDPREYVLIVLEIRMRKVKKEWQQLFEAIDEAIKTYRNDYWTKTSLTEALRRANDQKARADADRQRSQLREELQEWMRRSVEFLRKLIGPLKQYTEEWEEFRKTGMNYFTSAADPERSDRLVKSLGAVDLEFKDLGRLLPKLNHIMDCLCEDMSRDVNLRIAHENNESALLQQRTAMDLKVLTWITFLVLPLTLASSLLSTQEGYIPIKPSPWALLAWVAILEIREQHAGPLNRVKVTTANSVWYSDMGRLGVARGLGFAQGENPESAPPTGD